MNLVLHARTAPSDRIRIWIGAFQTTAPPQLLWFINGAAVVPVALRQISSVRPDDLLSKSSDPADQPRAFTGVYEFTGLNQDTLYEIVAQADGESESIEVRTLPKDVPAALDGSLNVLLVSCFHQHEDPSGLAGTIVSQLKATWKPH